MRFRSATLHDIPQICVLERLPEFRSFVGTWPQEQHLKTMADTDAVYIVAENPQGQITAFAILHGLQSELRDGVRVSVNSIAALHGDFRCLIIRPARFESR